MFVKLLKKWVVIVMVKITHTHRLQYTQQIKIDYYYWNKVCLLLVS